MVGWHWLEYGMRLSNPLGAWWRCDGIEVDERRWNPIPFTILTFFMQVAYKFLKRRLASELAIERALGPGWDRADFAMESLA